MPLSDVLSSIPGYAGFNASRLRNQGEEQGQLQQAVTLQNIIANVQKSQMMQGVTPENLKNPEYLRRLALATGKPEYATHAERLEQQQRDAVALETMRGARTGVAPDPQEFAQAADQGTPIPQQARVGGIFDDLAQSPNPQIAQQANALKAGMEKPGALSDPKYWQSQQSQLAARETALLNRPEKGEEPLHPVIGKDGKPVLLPRSEAKGMQPYVASQSPEGLLGPDEIKFMAGQYRAGDRTVMQNLGRGAQGAENIVKIRKEIARQTIEEGGGPKDVAAAIGEFEGFKSGQRVLGARQAQLEVAANVTKQFAPLALDASSKFDRTEYKTLNDVEKAVLSRTASPELRRFNFANTSLINAYARAINPSGVGTVSDKDHAREILDTGFSKGDYAAAVDQLQKEIEAELKAPGAVKGQMRDFMTGTPAKAVPMPVISGSLTPAEQTELAALKKKHGR